MHVLLVSSNSSGTGGGERYLAFLARGLREQDHRVTALVSTRPYMDDMCVCLSEAGVIVKREELIGLRDRRLRFVSALLDRNQIQKLRDLYRLFKPDVIHVNQQYDEDGLDYLKAALEAKLPVVGTIHLPMCRDKHMRPAGRARTILMRRWYTSNQYKKVFVSRDALTEFETLYGGKDSAAIPNGVPTPTTNSPRSERLPPGWNPSDPMIAFFGRLDPQKDPILLAESWMFLRSELPNCRLLFVGDGPLRGEIESWAKNHSVSASVYITGWFEDPSGWWEHVGVFVMTSKFEGMSLALLEAVSRGKKIAVTPCNGVAEVKAKAPWVRIMNTIKTEEIGAILHNLIESGSPQESEVRAARDYFSVSRMAEETAKVYRASIGQDVV